MCHFYVQCPPSRKYFDPSDVEHLLPLLQSWSSASSLTTFKLVLKIATLLALVTAKCYSDLTSLCIDNQNLFLQHHAVISFPYLMERWINQVIFLLRFAWTPISMLIFALFFYLKAYLRCTESFRKKPDLS